MSSEELIRVENLVKRFRLRNRSRFLAIDRVSFDLAVGESLGLVGETGAGKTTIARCLLGIETPDDGRISFLGEPVTRNGSGINRLRRNLQAVFQDPKAAMNPRWTAGSLVAEPIQRLTVESPERISKRVEASLRDVRLGPEFSNRYRHQLSGGQQQRVNIARAIAVEPKCIVLDEPVAALDSATKRDIILLLAELQRKRQLSYVLISHDLRIVRILCSKVIVLFRGRIVEMGPARHVIARPRHPYTQRLLSSQIDISRDDESTAGKADNWSIEDLAEVPPIGDLKEVSNGHFVADGAFTGQPE